MLQLHSLFMLLLKYVECRSLQCNNFFSYVIIIVSIKGLKLSCGGVKFEVWG